MENSHMIVEGDCRYGTPESAGIDLFPLMRFVVEPGEVVKVDTGFKCVIPPGHFGLIRDRSSIGSKGVIVGGGVIDSDYRGIVYVCLINCGRERYVHPGDKAVAQMIVLPYTRVELVNGVVVADDKHQGFGSTDRVSGGGSC
jgi:dUTP pyrophosphatase